MAQFAPDQREARIGAADIGEKNLSCLADIHDFVAAVALRRGNPVLHSFDPIRAVTDRARIRPWVRLVNTDEAKPLHPGGLPMANSRGASLCASSCEAAREGRH
ncbi:hypothetical protein TM239_32050 [Bradyrhizobium sp. TM239]|nr:hypothetical protein TM239_32050 [Bradyrhizobium sp. TM239]